MSIHKDVEKLIGAGVIDDETAVRIRAFYDAETRGASNVLLLIFGVLGALLVGLGIILIIAHNWDQMPRWSKTVFAFAPLIVGQALCAYTLRKKSDSRTWRESCGVFLSISVGACIALISQVYHLEGDLTGFLLIWIVLALPVMYVMESAIVALLYVVAVTAFASMQMGDYDMTHFGMAALLLGCVIPFYWYLMRGTGASRVVPFFHFLIPIAILYVFSSAIYGGIAWVMMMYMCLFAILYMIGYSHTMDGTSLRANGYVIIGAVGTVVILLIHSFDTIWSELYLVKGVPQMDEYGYRWVPISTMVLASGGLVYHFLRGTFTRARPLMPLFLIFGLLILIGRSSPMTAAIGANVTVLCISILMILAGVQRDHLGVLNFGLLILTALLICRFFDTEIPFVVRGLLFISVGISFFLANGYLIRKRKHDDQ